MALGYEYRDTAAAAGNNYIIIFYQIADGVNLDDRLWLRGSNHTAVAASCILYNLVALLCNHLVSLFLGHKCTDRLGRVLECRILCIDLYLGQDGGAARGDTAV